MGSRECEIRDKVTQGHLCKRTVRTLNLGKKPQSWGMLGCERMTPRRGAVLDGSRNEGCCVSTIGACGSVAWTA